MYLKYSLNKIILLICILTCNVSAQSDATESEKLLNKILTELNQKGIDTLIILKKGCTGNEKPFQESRDCNSNEDVYIIYRKEAKDFAILIKDCKANESIQIEDRRLIDYFYINKKYFRQYDKFEKESDSLLIHKGKLLYPLWPVHCCYNDLTFRDRNNQCHFYIVMDFEFDKSGRPRFTKYKWKTKQKEWVDLINTELKRIEIDSNK